MLFAFTLYAFIRLSFCNILFRYAPKLLISSTVGFLLSLTGTDNFRLYFYFYTPCLLFPYYDQDGSLIGVQSRYLGTNEKAPRFQFMSSQKTRLYNLPILNCLDRGDKLYISEGITDCLALLSDGLKAVAIPARSVAGEGSS